MRRGGIDHYRLWRVDQRGKNLDRLHALKSMVERAAIYLNLDREIAHDFLGSKSFIAALYYLCAKAGIKPIAIDDRVKLAHLALPLIGRDKQKNRPVLLLPNGVKRYAIYHDNDARRSISIHEVDQHFDSLIALSPSSYSGPMTLKEMSKSVSSFLSFGFMVMMACLSAGAVGLSLWAGSRLFSERTSNILTLVLMMVFIILGLCALLTSWGWRQRKDWPLFRLSMINEIYARVFALDSQELLGLSQLRFFSHLSAIKARVDWLFFSSSKLILASSLLLAFLIGAVLIDARAFLLLLSIDALSALVLIALNKKRARILLRSIAHQQELYQGLKNFRLALTFVVGLNLPPSFIAQLIKKKESMIESSIRAYSIGAVIDAWRFILPLLTLISMAIYIAMAGISVDQPSHMVLIAVASLCAGVVAHHVIEGSIDAFELADRGEQGDTSNVLWRWSGLKSHVEPVNIKGRMEFIGVSFAYGASGELKFKNTDLLIEAHRFTVIRGASGQGKTTLLKLLLGVLLPSAGQVVIDGQDVRALNKSSIRQCFGVIFSQPQLFAASIMDNIICHRAIGQSAIKKLLLSHEIFDRLIDLPMGLQTHIYWHGKNMSRWESVLITLARALVHSPKILLMDEILLGLSPPEHMMLIDYLAQKDITRVLTTTSSLSMKSDEVIDLNRR